MYSRHGQVIAAIARGMKARAYLELGVAEGLTLRQVAREVPLVVGVDADPNAGRGLPVLHMKTAEFFESEPSQRFDLILIDASHAFDDVLADFLGAEQLLNPGGTIFLHDTDPENERLIAPEWCGDAYLFIDWIRSNRPDLESVTLPVDEAGLTLVRRKQDRRAGCRRSE